MILPLLLGAALASGQHESPRAYMERLYASYRNSSFNPLTHPARYFSARLAAALNEDARLAHGEVGYVDGDPICQCQDPDGLRAIVIGVSQKGPAEVDVRVSISLSGYEARPATFSLIMTKAGWRIDDVWSSDEPSFRRGIEESNRAQRSKH